MNYGTKNSYCHLATIAHLLEKIKSKNYCVDVSEGKIVAECQLITKLLKLFEVEGVRSC